jgi:MFS family permease
LLPWTATLFVFAPIGGGLVNRLGERPLVVAGLVLQAIGMAWIVLTATPGLAYVNLVAPLVLAGAGFSLAMPAAQNAVLSAVAPGEIGKASGTFNMARFLGGVFGVAVQVAAFAATGSFGSPQAFSVGFVPAIGLAAALSLMAAVAGMWLPGRRALGAAPAVAKA